MLGTLSVGFLLDDALPSEMKRDHRQRSRVRDGRSDPRRDAAARAVRRARRPPANDRHLAACTLQNEDYEALSRPLAATDGRRWAASGPVALILRSRTEQLRSLQAIHTGARASRPCSPSLLGTVLSFAVARTITRPLAAITGVMREVAATGDLTRKIALRQGDRWDDEDARLLATTFNTLTDSIARFQREISQKERLTSLGRLSTVIAHEVRNPLMIIKASLHTLRRPDMPRRPSARPSPTSTKRSCA